MRASSVRATADAVISGDESDQDLDASLDQWVREPSNVRDAGSVPNQAVEGPAHPSNRLVAQLNATWRVVADPLQWRLQRRKGNPRTGTLAGETDPSAPRGTVCSRCVREYCGDVEPAALAKLTTLPEHYADAKTWTFAEQTKLTPTVNQSRWYLRLWRTVRLAINHLATANLLFLSLSALGIDHAEEESRLSSAVAPGRCNNAAQEAVAREQVHHHAPSHQHHGGGQVR